MSEDSGSSIQHLAVVVIGRNEGERLRACLRSVQSLRLPASLRHVATIYVDSNSSDNSLELARSLGAHTIPLPTGPWTAARGRNIGWRAALELHPIHWVLFLDGDTILDPDFLPFALAQADSEPSIASVFGLRIESRPQQSIYTWVLALDWLQDPHQHAHFGGDVLLRVAALQATGGYDDSLIAGEDPELSHRMACLGWRHLQIDRLMTTHDLAIQHFSQYWARLVRSGYAYADVAQRFRHTPERFWYGASRRNLLRGSFWLVSLIASLAFASSFALLHHPSRAIASIGLLLAIFGAVSMRSAWRYRRRSSSRITLFFYGIHSQFQQIPILLGQLAWFSDHLRSHRRALIEYK